MKNISTNQPVNKICRIKELTEITGLSRSTIYDKINPKSPRYDPTFPNRIKLGSRAVGWLYQDITNWLEQHKFLTA